MPTGLEDNEENEEDPEKFQLMIWVTLGVLSIIY